VVTPKYARLAFYRARDGTLAAWERWGNRPAQLVDS
jgi:hypothetical protein